MTELSKINLNTALKAGDQIQIELKPRFDFGKNVTAYLLAGNIYRITQNHPEFTVNSWDYLDTDTIRLNVTVNDLAGQPQIVEAGVITPAVIIGLVVGVSIIAISATAWKLSNTVEKTIDTPGGKAIAYSVPIAAIAALIIGLYLWFKK